MRSEKVRDPIWAVMPFVDLWEEYTRQAAEDVLAQTIPTNLILVSNGSREEEKDKMWAWWHNERRGASGNSAVPQAVIPWHYYPALTLSQAWNAALEACWGAGADRALVVNNDLRLPGQLLEHLSAAMDETKALFVSAVNTGSRDVAAWFRDHTPLTAPSLTTRGGPDYSCFLISRECHARFPFDPQFTYCNDLDHHRRVMLAGHGRRIFSVAVPYLHFASRTVAAHPEMHEVAAQHRRLYAAKWGGGVNEETHLEPYVEPAQYMRDDWAYGRVAKPPITTPELQELNRLGRCCYRDHDADGNCDQHPARGGVW